MIDVMVASGGRIIRLTYISLCNEPIHGARDGLIHVGHRASLRNCLNNARSSSAGPCLPSLINGIAE
jgi:hypothetical protein